MKYTDEEYQQQMKCLLSQFNKKQKRLYVAFEANCIGLGGGQILSQITGLSPMTISRGRKELKALLLENSIVSVRNSRVGRPLAKVKQPALLDTLEQLLTNEVAGDPMTEQKWIRSSLKKLSIQLKERNLFASPALVGRLLKEMGFSLRANFKKKNGVRTNYPERDEQFKYIALQRQIFSSKGFPVISVDTKKKELIGDLKKEGKAWCRKSEEVYEHDFRSLATCKAVPYGIYDVTRNEGFVYVGTSNDTPEFAVEAIGNWWNDQGYLAYPRANELLILADSGGSNGFRSRAWKYQLQRELCNKYNLKITICHYPVGCSKWNPIESRLFSQISINWAGKPLRTLEMMLGYIRGTSTTKGLTVKSFLLNKLYKKGQKVSGKELQMLSVELHTTCPQWNYSINPVSPTLFEM